MRFVEKPSRAGQSGTAGAVAWPPASQLPCVPDHEPLHLIASGAYGEVWLARNVVGMLRAVKIVRRDRHDSEESFHREFKGLQKFEPVSRLHEGLVDILTVGLLPDSAGFYYVMELADGVSGPPFHAAIADGKPADSSSPRPERLKSAFPAYEPRTLRADLKTRGALPADEVIALGLKLTAALAHLHAQSLVHRDVKPSNIVFVGGEPKLADAGLVAGVDDARSLVGTAGYIAPEGPGTPRADLYALGKVLYEAAFGKDRQEFPRLPADVTSRPDHVRLLELNAILLKACATDGRERYQSSEQMRADLDILQRGKSVQQHRAWQTRFRLAKKVAVAAGISGLLVLGFALVRKELAPPRTPIKSTGITFESSGTRTHEAFDLFWQGTEVIRDATALGYLKAISRFESAVALDPKFALAWSKMAFCWSQLDLKEHTPPLICRPKAREAALKALALDYTLAEAHVTLASVHLFFEWDWTSAERELRQALRIDSGPDQQLSMASFLSFTGREEDAVRQVRKLVKQNPEKLSWHWTLGIYLSYIGRDEEAIAEINKYLEIAPNSPSPRYYLAKILWRQGKYEEAMALWERFHVLVNNSAGTEAVAHEAFRQAGGGESGVAAYCRVWLQEMERENANRTPDEWMPPMNWVWFYMLAGDMDNAFRWWERGLDERQPLALEAIVEPFWKPLWDDPRYDAVLRRTGLDRYYPQRLHDAQRGATAR